MKYFCFRLFGLIGILYTQYPASNNFGNNFLTFPDMAYPIQWYQKLLQHIGWIFEALLQYFL